VLVKSSPDRDAPSTDRALIGALSIPGGKLVIDWVGVGINLLSRALISAVGLRLKDGIIAELLQFSSLTGEEAMLRGGPGGRHSPQLGWADGDEGRGVRGGGGGWGHHNGRHGLVTGLRVRYGRGDVTL
jgi:hypothetical protein